LERRKIELADVCIEARERVFENGLIVRIRLACSLPRQKSQPRGKNSLQNIFLESTFQHHNLEHHSSTFHYFYHGERNRQERSARSQARRQKSRRSPQIPGAPRPANPVKKAKKLLSREKKSAINTNPPGPEKFPIPMGRPKPLRRARSMRSGRRCLRSHLGLIESHIRALDRVMQSMRVRWGRCRKRSGWSGSWARGETGGRFVR